MGISSQMYNTGVLNLLLGDFINTAVGAQLLSSSYSFSPDHARYSDVSGHAVGNSIQLTGKTSGLTEDNDAVFNFDDLVYTDQGTLQARWVVFHFGVGSSDDRLIYVVDLDDTAQDQEITPSLKLEITGAIRFPVPPAFRLETSGGGSVDAGGGGETGGDGGGTSAELVSTSNGIGYGMLTASNDNNINLFAI